MPYKLLISRTRHRFYELLLSRTYEIMFSVLYVSHLHLFKTHSVHIKILLLEIFHPVKAIFESKLSGLVIAWVTAGTYCSFRPPPGGGGGVLRFGSDGGVPLKPSNPYPSLRVILAEKGTHY